MSTGHKGNIQPQLDLEEHLTISGVGGKKVYVIDSQGNIIDFGGDSNVAKKITSDGDDTYIAIAAIGSAQASAVWQAFKISVSGDDTVFTWADGDENFDNVATDLTALSYS